MRSFRRYRLLPSLLALLLTLGVGSAWAIPSCLFADGEGAAKDCCPGFETMRHDDGASSASPEMHHSMTDDAGSDTDDEPCCNYNVLPLADVQASLHSLHPNAAPDMPSVTLPGPAPRAGFRPILANDSGPPPAPPPYLSHSSWLL